MSDSAFDEERDRLIRRIINVTGDSISLLESNEMEVMEKVENEEWHEGDATHQENHATNGTDSAIHYCTVAKEPNQNAIKCGRNIVNCGSDAAQQPIAALKCEFDTTRCDNDSPKGHQHEISRSDASSDPKTCPSDQNQHKTDKHSLPNDQEDICCRDNMEKSSKSNDQCDHVNYDCKKQSIRKCDCHSPAAPECQCRAKVIDHNLVSKSDSSEKTNDSVENENSTATSDSVFCDCKSIMSSQRSSKIDLRADPTKGEEKSSKKVSHSTSDSTSICTYPTQSTLMEFCRICHCEGDTEIGPLIAPCYCRGSLRYVHQACLQQWIKSSDTKHCELCGYHFVMDSKLMPFHKWKKLSMSTTERRKIMFSVMFHVIAITCVIWSLYVLIERTANEIKVGKLQWPFWTKLVVVAIGFTGGLVFMYVQCKVYVQLWKRLKAHNRVIYVKNNSTDTDSPSDDEDSVQGSNEAPTPQRQENDAVIVEIQS